MWVQNNCQKYSDQMWSLERRIQCDYVESWISSVVFKGITEKSVL